MTVPRRKKIKAGVSDGIVETIAKHAADWIADEWTSLAIGPRKPCSKSMTSTSGLSDQNPGFGRTKDLYALGGDPIRGGEATNAVNTVLSI